MGLIRVLPPSLVNRIAAGECVERPASVAKELVENALDAGASRIEVDILDGGRGLIGVADDGTGMDADDLRLSVAPHATSKIQTDDDLFNIHTLGFRGEALASIGAVSRLQVTSRRRESDVGYALRVEAGLASEPAPCAAPPGTTVEVRDLFYCVPARRKFLRTNPTELGHVTEQFARIALAHPGVSFTLKHQNRELHRLGPTQDRRQRIADFYGPELAGALLPIRREGGGVLVEGLAAPPAQCRKSTKWEYVFANGRYVRDRFVSHAVREAYRSLIQPDEYPVIFLFLTIDPTHVDVNVHPTKIEVRWRDSNYVHAQVLAALREKFLSTNLDRALRPPPRDDEAYRQRVRDAMVDFFTKAGPAAAPASLGTGAHEGREGRGRRTEGPRDQGAQGLGDQHGPDPARASERPIAAGATPWSETHGLPASAVQGATTADAGALLDVTPVTQGAPRAAPCSLRDGGDPGHHARYSAPDTVPTARSSPDSAVAAPAGSRTPRAMQIHDSYLLAETDEGLMIIDQHALHERILYEDLRRRLTEKPLESQQLLMPEVIRVAPDRMEVLELHADTLQQLGLVLTPVGPKEVALQAFPLLLERADPTAFVRDLLDLLGEHGNRPDTESLMHDVLDLMACKAAVKAGDALTPAEVAALVARREIAERSSHCPHGRPTTLRLTLRDLERQFKRH